MNGDFALYKNFGKTLLCIKKVEQRNAGLNFRPTPYLETFTGFLAGKLLVSKR